MVIKDDPVFIRRRRVALGGLVVMLTLVVLGLGRLLSPAEAASTSAAPRAQVVASPAGNAAAPAPTPSPQQAQGRPGPSAQTTPVRILRLAGGLNSKSVVAAPDGQVFAQNMMYRHTVTVFGADGALRSTIKDSVDLAAFGVEGHAGTSRGAPVEVAFSPDGARAWVSNYSMYGQNFLPEGRDACTGPEGSSPSFVYEIDTRSYAITRVVQVGHVPKYVAVTPDNARVLVSNWCSMDLSVVDRASGKVSATVPLPGRHPRGIVVSPDSRTAYVTIMGSNKVVSVDLTSNTVREFAHTGKGARHIVISPDGKRLYVTNNDAGTISEVDRGTGKVTREVAVGRQPRSMAISTDGGALYVVNYASSTMSKIRTSDLKVVDTVVTDGSPIGITYEPTRKAVWVACYSGSILVYDDSRLAAT